MQVTHIPVAQIVAGANDRTTFDPTALAALAANIAEHGLASPITVRAVNDAYELVAGERRTRAVRLLGWPTIPAIVAKLTDAEAAALMLAENVARQDIDPVDEANAYAARIRLYDWTPAQCATAGGVTLNRVQARLKLLRLRPDILQLLRTGNLRIGYAEILANADLDTDRQLLAMTALRDAPRPTPGWFRRVVSELLAQQMQGEMFTTPILGGELAAPVALAPLAEPPHPATTRPCVDGFFLKERLSKQIAFWRDAADAWERQGRPHKRQECMAAAQALQSALDIT